MQTLDDMRDLNLLTDEQHAQIHTWISSARTPEAILQMPPDLWRTFALASVLMDFDADVMQPPLLDAGVPAQFPEPGSPPPALPTS